MQRLLFWVIGLQTIFIFGHLNTMEKRTHILCLAAFALFCAHGASATYSIDDFFRAPLYPDMESPRTNQGIDVTSPMQNLSLDDASLDIDLWLAPTTHVAQVPVSQDSDDLSWIETMLDTQSPQDPPAATQDQEDLSWIETMLDAYSWPGQPVHTTMSLLHGTAMANLNTHAPKAYVCKSCGHISPGRNKLREHMRDTHPIIENLIRLSCNLCSKTFTTDLILKKHRRSMHGIQLQGVPKHRCDECEEMFNLHRDLRKHRRKHTTQVEYHCHLCPMICKTHGGLTNHVVKHQNVASGTTKPVQECVCPQCGKVCASRAILGQHVSRTHPVNPPTRVDPLISYPCNQCIKVCKNQRGLTKHRSTAHPKKVLPKDPRHPDYLARKYACKECIQLFVSNENLQTHIRKIHRKRDAPANNPVRASTRASTNDPVTVMAQTLTLTAHKPITGDGAAAMQRNIRTHR